MSVTVRLAKDGDAAAIAAIHNEGIAERQATFETRPRTPREVAGELGVRRLVLVAVEDERVLGWARLSPASARACYSGVREASVYVTRECRGRGIGSALLEALVQRAGAA